MKFYISILLWLSLFWSFEGIAMDAETDSDSCGNTESLISACDSMQETAPHFLRIPVDVLGVICKNFSDMPISSRIRAWGALKSTCTYLKQCVGALEKDMFYSDDHDTVVQEVIRKSDVALLRYLYHWSYIPVDKDYMHKQCGTAIQQLSDEKKQFQSIISHGGDGVNDARRECKEINQQLDSITIMIKTFDIPDVAGDDQNYSLKNMMFWTRGSTGCFTLRRMICALGLCCSITTAIVVTIVVTRLLATRSV